MKRAKTIAALLFVGIVFLYATAARDGHNWKGDFSQYVMHAQNLVHGAPYTDLGVLFFDGIGHKGTPPGYPIAMAPLIALFGLNFIVLKYQIALFFALGLWIYWRFSKDQMPAQWALATLAFLAFTPWILKFSNNLLSDIPYFTASLLAMWLAHRYFARPPAWSAAAYLGLAIVLASTFRSMGVLLMGSCFVYALIFRRTHLRQVLLIMTISYACTLLINRQFEAGGSYASQFSLAPAVIASSIWQNLIGLERHLTRLLALYPSRNEAGALYLFINKPILIAYLGLMALGLYRSLKKRGIAVSDVYSLSILMVILIYPYPVRPRYLLPILPFAHVYVIVGFRTLWAAWAHRAAPLKTYLRPPYGKMLPAAIWMPLFFAYWSHYALQPATPEANILQDPDVTALFQEIRDRQPEISRVLFWRPRILRLFSDVQTASIYNLNEYPWTASEIHRLAHHGVSHLALDPNNPALAQFVAQNPNLFVSQYRNRKFELLKLTSPRQTADALP